MERTKVLGPVPQRSCRIHKRIRSYDGVRSRESLEQKSVAGVVGVPPHLPYWIRLDRITVRESGVTHMVLACRLAVYNLWPLDNIAARDIGVTVNRF